MAKNINPVIKLQGTFQSVTFVRSKVYKQHIRSKRGTYKEAACNEVLLQNAEKTAGLNSAAKKVYDLLKLCTGDLREGQLWQQILGRMRKSGSPEFSALAETLKGLEINRKYPLERFGKLPVIRIKWTKQRLKAVLSVDAGVHLKKASWNYLYELTALFFNSGENKVAHSSCCTEWISRNEREYAYEFTFNRPALADAFLLCLKLQAGEHGKAIPTFPARGMIIMAAGGCGEGQG